jgi:amino-acid N-acetyltransferase
VSIRSAVRAGGIAVRARNAAVRGAMRADAESIHALITAHVADGALLARSVAEIRRNIRDFVVAEHDGEIIGCGALHHYGPHLAEIRSITVRADERRHGVGHTLVDALLKRARRRGITAVCLFTRQPEFFAPFGFTVIERNRVPEKFYKDCRLCPRRHACDEIAMAIGELSAAGATVPLRGDIAKLVNAR